MGRKTERKVLKYKTNKYIHDFQQFSNLKQKDLLIIAFILVKLI